eukprot:426261-Pyramimonas_sp.AAC.1
MQTYASNLRPIAEDQKDGNNDRPLTPKEVCQLRGLLGALQLPSSQACSDAPASVSIRRGQLPTATAATAREVNTTLRYYKQNADV